MRLRPGWRSVAENAVAEPTAARTHPGLILGVARFYYDPRGSMRGVLDSSPAESRLLAYAMISATILLTGQLVQVGAEGGEQTMAKALAQTVSLLFFVPLAYYGFAALGTWIARKFGGQGTWSDGRAAFFWAALVSAPIMLAAKLAQLSLVPDTTGYMVIGELRSIFFAWALAVCFAETFDFKNALLVLVFIIALSMAFVFALWMITV